MAEVEVIGVQNGWFKIQNARDNESLMDIPQRPMFKGTGWVSGKKLTIKSQAETGHEKPDATSAVLVNGQLDSLVEDGKLIDCKGHWARIDINTATTNKDVLESLDIKPAAYKGADKGHFRIWANKICGLQETSCSGGLGE